MANDSSRKVDTRQRIVAATVSALQRGGLPPLSYDAVAQEAGLTRQAVRYHFPDHEALMVATCDRLADAYRAALIENAGRLQGPHRLDMFLDFYFDLLDGTPKPRDDAAYDAMMSLATRWPGVRGHLVGQYRLLGQVMCHEFRVSHPGLDLRSAEELSWLFVCLMYGHWKMVATLGVSRAHNRVTRAAMDRLIRSYCDNAPPMGQTDQVWETRP